MGLDIRIYGDKYRIQEVEGGHIYATRDGTPYKGMIANDLVAALAHEVETLRRHITRLEDQAKIAKQPIPNHTVIGLPLDVTGMATLKTGKISL